MVRKLASAVIVLLFAAALTPGQNVKLGSGVVVAGAKNIPTYSYNGTGLTANVSSTTVVTAAQNSAGGMYTVDVFEILTTADGTSSNLPYFYVDYTDADTGISETIPITCGSGCTTDTVGLWSNAYSATMPQISGSGMSIDAKAGTAISTHSGGYASNTPNTMQYAIHMRVRGPE